jgi:diphosphomevalonate decarboxylase
MPGAFPLELSEKGRARFLKHFSFLKTQMQFSEKNFLIQSANNFPSDCGLASSASSFAALTLAAYELAQKFNPKVNFTREQLAEFSRQGSGSSCRSLFPEWSVWKPTGATGAEFKCEALWHTAVIVEADKKLVSSSEAHLRVSSSELFKGRPERAEKRLLKLSELLNQKQTRESWREAFEICWAEFWDMHALFETSQPSFGYMSKNSMDVLEQLRHFWQHHQDGPLVTMDAGANVHLLWRQEQWESAQRLLQNLKLKFKLVSSRDT